jgi:hypothetical protein
MGEGRELLVAENLIETVKWLETQELVHYTQEDSGIRVQLNLEGIDAWMKGALNKLNVKWTPYKPCFYGIVLLETKPELVVRNEHALLMIPSKCFCVQTSEPPRTYGNDDIVVHFADIFCEKINLRQLVERISSNKDTAFVLKLEKEAFYLNEHVIVTARSNMRKAIMQILIERKNNEQEYISFEGIADVLQENSEFVIDDIHNQIYKHVHILQKRGIEKVSQLAKHGGFIEMHNGCCRLNPLIWVAN